MIQHKLDYVQALWVRNELKFDEIEDDQYLWGSAEMYDFYYEVAKKGLYYTSSVSRTKSLSILS